MDKIYYHLANPSSFASADKLRRASKKPKAKVEKFLRSSDTYTRHKPVRKKFTRNRTVVSSVNQEWQIDTLDLIKFHHEKTRYLLVVVDVLSRMAWGLPLTDKFGTTVVKALEPLFRKHTPQVIYSDRGTEFLNHKVQSLFKKYKIRHWLSSSVHKASLAERLQQTLTQKLFKYFDSRPVNDKTFIEDLNDLFKSYNGSIHRAHNHTPMEVFKMKNVRHLWPVLYRKAKRVKPTLAVNDYVRIVRETSRFKKSYEAQWTREIFRVTKVMTRKEIPMYLIEDLLHRLIDSTFYAQELNKVRKPTSFLPEKYLKYRRKGGKRERLVKWMGYNDPAFNSWEEY